MVLHLVHSLNIGGTQRGLISLLDQPALKRIRHIVCTLRSAGPLVHELPPSIKTIALNASGRSRTVAPRLAKVIASHKPNVVHARNWGTWIDAILACRLARRHRAQLVLGFHGLETDTGFCAQRRRRARWFNFAARRFTAVAHAGSEQLSRELNATPQNVHVLQNGVDADHFAPLPDTHRNTLRARLGIAPDERVVVMIGSLVAVKDHAAAIEAAAQCPPPLRMLIAGDGPLRDALEHDAQARNRRSRITFLGERHDVADLLRVADLFLSSSQYEQMSIAVMEAMAAGLPVIATDVGDHSRLIKHAHCGIIVPPRDPAAIAQAMKHLLPNPEICRALGAAARSRIISDYDLSRAAEHYALYYDSIAAAQLRRQQEPSEYAA